MTIVFDVLYDTGHKVTRRIQAESLDKLFYGKQQTTDILIRNIVQPITNLIGVELEATHMWVEWKAENVYDMD